MEDKHKSSALGLPWADSNKPFQRPLTPSCPPSHPPARHPEPSTSWDAQFSQPSSKVHVSDQAPPSTCSTHPIATLGKIQQGHLSSFHKAMSPSSVLLHLFHDLIFIPSFLHPASFYRAPLCARHCTRGQGRKQIRHSPCPQGASCPDHIIPVA